MQGGVGPLSRFVDGGGGCSWMFVGAGCGSLMVLLDPGCRLPVVAVGAREWWWWALVRHSSMMVVGPHRRSCRRVKARRLCSLMVVAGARGCLWALGVVR
jgi:hypothetical protein